MRRSNEVIAVFIMLVLSMAIALVMLKLTECAGQEKRDGGALSVKGDKL
jgi:NADH:ubiquinone oxidoreductase subunit 3 (subunit A)